MMRAISYTAVRNNLASTIDAVNDDHVPVLITRQNGSSAVLLSLDDFNSLNETSYLLHSGKNASRLLKSVAEIKRKVVVKHKLVE